MNYKSKIETDKLNKLLSDENILEYLSKTYKTVTLKEYCTALREQYGFSSKYLLSKLPLDERYARKMLSQTRNPSFSFIIGLGLELGAEVEEVNNLLRLSNLPTLYPQRNYDRHIIHCIIKKKNIKQTNEFLASRNLPLLFEKSER